MKALLTALLLVLASCAGESSTTTTVQAQLTTTSLMSTTTLRSTTTSSYSTTSTTSSSSSTTTTTTDVDAYEWSQVTFDHLLEWNPGGLSSLPDGAAESLRTCRGGYQGISAMTQALITGVDPMLETAVAAEDGTAPISDASTAFSQWADAALTVGVTNKELTEIVPDDEAQRYFRDLSGLFEDVINSAKLISLFGFDVDNDKIDQGTIDVWLPSLIDSALGLQSETFFFPESIDSRCR